MGLLIMFNCYVFPLKPIEPTVRRWLQGLLLGVFWIARLVSSMSSGSSNWVTGVIKVGYKSSQKITLLYK
jgi:hypothetical protein